MEAVGLYEAVAMESEEVVVVDVVTDVDAEAYVDAVAEVDADRSTCRLWDIVAEDENDAESEMVRVKNGLGIPSVPKASSATAHRGGTPPWIGYEAFTRHTAHR